MHKSEIGAESRDLFLTRFRIFESKNERFMHIAQPKITEIWQVEAAAESKRKKKVEIKVKIKVGAVLFFTLSS